MGELGLVIEFCDHRRYSTTTSYLPYKEGVAGSNPASPTYKLPANSGILRTRRDGWEALPGPFAATRMRLSFRQHRFNRLGGGVLHVSKDVRVGVEGDGCGGVAEHLGDYLRIDLSPSSSVADDARDLALEVEPAGGHPGLATW